MNDVGSLLLGSPSLGNYYYTDSSSQNFWAIFFPHSFLLSCVVKVLLCFQVPKLQHQMSTQKLYINYKTIGR